jgi:hypothetical protein
MGPQYCEIHLHRKHWRKISSYFWQGQGRQALKYPRALVLLSKTPLGDLAEQSPPCWGALRPEPTLTSNSQSNPEPKEHHRSYHNI